MGRARVATTMSNRRWLPLLLSTLLFFIAVFSSWNINKGVKGYFALLMLLEVGTNGCFVALDFFLFYVFWEVMLLPMYFLIGIWGGARREYAAIKFFLYTFFGGVLMLVALVAIYMASGYGDAEPTFNLLKLAVMAKDPESPFEALEGEIREPRLHRNSSMGWAYLAKLDEERKSFNFRKVLLINPPVSLYNSISLLDRMTQNIPGGEDNFDQFFNKLVQGFSEVYKQEDDIGEDFLYTAYKAMDLQNEQLAALIGVSFRMSSASLIFTSDVMTDFGFVKPKGLELDRYASITKYNQVLTRVGFTDYYHEFFYPFYKKDYPDMTRDEFISAISLTEIADYLRGSEKITVMHNQDDIILLPGEIEFFNDVFGDRATIYPYGGHCGNMNYSENVAHMVGTFTGEGQ